LAGAIAQHEQAMAQMMKTIDPLFMRKVHAIDNLLLQPFLGGVSFA
jgi:hypothetical protein